MKLRLTNVTRFIFRIIIPVIYMKLPRAHILAPLFVPLIQTIQSFSRNVDNVKS